VKTLIRRLFPFDSRQRAISLRYAIRLVAITLVSSAIAWFGTSPAAAQSAAKDGEPAGAVPGDVENWTYWRGPSFDGVSATTNLPDSWDPDGGEGSNLLWKREEFAGRSTPVVFNGKLYTTLRAEPGTQREGERVVCIDAKTGELLWENRFNVWLSDVPDTRIGWSSVTVDPATGYVYCLGVCDYFVCMDGETGNSLAC
jgi:hypothetical protein